jgi:RNA polymerase sigma-70 factor (ECF subfamily)
MLGPRFEFVLESARAGDEAAFAVLWRDLHPALMRYLRVVAGDDAEDIASETWSRVASLLTLFEGGEDNFRAWIFTIARRRAIDWQRHAARRPAIPVAPDSYHLAGHSADDPSDVALEAISTDAALELVATLPPDQAEVVMLRAIAGLDVTRVAEIVGKRPGTVRVLAHRGLRSLALRIPAPIATGAPVVVPPTADPVAPPVADQLTNSSVRP